LEESSLEETGNNKLNWGIWMTSVSALPGIITMTNPYRFPSLQSWTTPGQVFNPPSKDDTF
jgi:predicted benzoate:H+ symporter BenE